MSENTVNFSCEPHEVNAEMAKLLKIWREEHGTQSKVANELCDISYEITAAAIGHYEKGRRQIPIELILMLYHEFGLNLIEPFMKERS